MDTSLTIKMEAAMKAKQQVMGEVLQYKGTGRHSSPDGQGSDAHWLYSKRHRMVIC
jgi:hypothetical protein